MDLNTRLLIAAALLPAIVLCIYVYKKDRVEKEPVSLLAALFLLGVISCAPAAVLEKLFTGIIDSIFSKNGSLHFLTEKEFYTYNFVYYFFGIALVEEGLKWIILNFVTSGNKNLNCLFDGIIYAVFVSMGFAALENVLYVTNNGWINAFFRAILSVPGHMFFAVMMGYYYSRWQLFKKVSETESVLKKEGLIDENAPLTSYKTSAFLSIFVPVLIHCIYNFCCSLSEFGFTFIFIVFIIFLYILCFSRIKKMSVKDEYSDTYVMALIYRKYPYLSQYEVVIGDSNYLRFKK